MADRPNIIQITTHDSGRHFGCYGHPTLHTPNVDRLASEGVKLTNHFGTVPICSASRASQLTGLYPQTNGLLHLCFGPNAYHIRDNVPHMANLLKAAGYRTHLIGMQHETADLERLEFDSIRSERGNKVVGKHVYRYRTADETDEEAAKFLRNEASVEQPFYMQTGFFETHTYNGKFDFGGVEPDASKGVEVPPYVADTSMSQAAMAGYQGAVRKADAAVGVILDALRDSGLEENTVFVFTTDHGIEVPRAKWHLYDPGVGIACVIRYPAGGIAGGRDNGLLLSNVDYLPTMLTLAGLETPEHVQGLSFAHTLTEEGPAPVREAIYGMFHATNSRFVRTNRYKLIRNFQGASRHLHLPATYEDLLTKDLCHPVELYDLEADPLEFNDIARKPENAAVVARLDDMLWTWLESQDDPLLKGPIRWPAYERTMAEYEEWRRRTKG